MIRYLIDTGFASHDEAYVQECLAWFPPQQAEAVLRMKFLQGRLEKTAEYLLLLQLMREAGLQGPVVLLHDPQGKPCLQDLPQYHISISHCRQAVAVAISDEGSIGIDVEGRRQIRPALIQKACNPQEQQQIACSADPSSEFIRIWTQKEAYSKYLGTGLVTDLHQLLPSARQAGVFLQSLPQPFGWLSLCHD